MSNEAHRWVMATMAVVVALAGGLCLLHLRRSLQSAVLRISMAHEIHRARQPRLFALGLLLFFGMALALLITATRLLLAACLPSMP
jgi:uncharacterized membrane protein